MSREMNYLTMEELEQTMKKTGLYADYIRNGCPICSVQLLVNLSR